MFTLYPLDHEGRIVPYPIHYVFSPKALGRQALLLFLGMSTVVSVFSLTNIALESGWAELISIALVSAPTFILFAAVASIALVGGPVLAWPWSRKSFGRRLVEQVKSMSNAELEALIEGCEGELLTTERAGRRVAVERWANWLRVQRAERDRPSKTVETLSVRSPRRTLFALALCALLPVAVMTAVLAHPDLSSVRAQPSAIAVLTVCLSLWFLAAALCLLGALGSRVELDIRDLRERRFGRVAWSVPRACARLVGANDGHGWTYEVWDTGQDKRVGTITRWQFAEKDMLKLVTALGA